MSYSHKTNSDYPSWIKSVQVSQETHPSFTPEKSIKQHMQGYPLGFS